MVIRMRSLNNGWGGIAKLGIFVIMALLLTYTVTVAPASSASTKCKDYCEPEQKSPGTAVHECVKDYKVCIYWENGVKKTLWAHKCRDCVKGYYYQICHHEIWCPNSGCVYSGAPFTKTGKSYSDCQPWVTTFYSTP